MPSYLTNLLTTTTSRYDSLRRTLLSSTDERDGDTPDDSHISRVLRAYYAEKSRPLPDWLPPDPRSVRPQLQHPEAVSTYQSYSTSARNWIVGGGSTAAAATARPGLAPQASSRRAGGISDLWDRPAGTSQAQAQATPSLRRGEGSTLRSSGTFEPEPMPAPRGNSPSSQQPRPSGPTPQQPQHNYSYNSAPSRLQPAGGRPLPSQRAGTTQQSGSLRGARSGAAPEGDYFGAPHASGTGAAGGGGGAVPPTPGISAQDRLKARLWGGARPASPGPGRGSGVE